MVLPLLRCHPWLAGMGVRPSVGDVVIVGCTVGDESSYLVVAALTKRALGGPFSSLREALRLADRVRGECAVWHTSVDSRGRELSALVKLATWFTVSGEEL
jgi:hypothetical protein